MTDVIFKDEDVVFKDEDVTFDSSSILSVSDSHIIQAASNSNVYVHGVVFADEDVSFSDGDVVFTPRAPSGAVALIVDSGEQLQYADDVGLSQEYTAAVKNSENEQHAESVVLGVTGTVSTGRVRSARYAYYPEEAIEKLQQEEYLLYTLQVKPSAIGNAADVVQLSERVEVSVRGFGLSIRDNGSNVITLTQKRRKRFTQEEEIMLLAA